MRRKSSTAWFSDVASLRRLAWAAGASFSLHALVLSAPPWQAATHSMLSANHPPPLRGIEVRLEQQPEPADRISLVASAPTRRGEDAREMTGSSAGSALLPSPGPLDTEDAEAAQPLQLPPSSRLGIGHIATVSSYSAANEAMRRQIDMQMRMQKMQGLWSALSREIFMRPVHAEGNCDFRREDGFEPRCSGDALQQWADETSVRSLCAALVEEGASFTVLEISSVDGQVSVHIR